MLVHARRAAVVSGKPAEKNIWLAGAYAPVFSKGDAGTTAGAKGMTFTCMLTWLLPSRPW